MVEQYTDQADLSSQIGPRIPTEFAIMRNFQPTATTTLLLLRIAGFARYETGCYLSVDRLAADCGTTRKLARDTLARLIEKNVIIATQEPVYGKILTCYKIHPRLLEGVVLSPVLGSEPAATKQPKWATASAAKKRLPANKNSRKLTGSNSRQVDDANCHQVGSPPTVVPATMPSSPSTGIPAFTRLDPPARRKALESNKVLAEALAGITDEIINDVTIRDSVTMLARVAATRTGG